MAFVAATQNWWHDVSGGILRMRRLTTVIAYWPFDMVRLHWRVAFDVEPSITAMKSLVTTIPSSLFFVLLFGVRLCSIIFMLEVRII